MIQSSTIYKNTKNINNDSSLLDVSMECAFFLDQIGALAFKNWIKGEVVSGPFVDKFFCTISLMYPVTSLPDSTVLERLRKMNCKISYRNDEYKRVVTYKEDDSDIFKQKNVIHKVWILTIKIPNRYLALDGNTKFTIDDVESNYDELEGIYNDDVQTGADSGDGGDGDADDDFSIDDDFEL